MDDNSLTIAGNLTADPVLKFTTAGTAVGSFRLAHTPRYLDRASGEWRDGDSLFLTVNCWRGLAENVASSLRRGDRVLVKGRLRQRDFETSPGEHRSVVELEADQVGPELARAIASPRRLSRDTAHPAVPQDGVPSEAAAEVEAEDASLPLADATAGPAESEPSTGEDVGAEAGESSWAAA